MFEKCVLGRVTFKQSIFRFKLPNQIVWISVLAVQKKKIKKGRSMFDYTLKECMLSETECEFVNPLSPDVKMHILPTVLHTFLMELVRRICLNIKTSHPW